MGSFPVLHMNKPISKKVRYFKKGAYDTPKGGGPVSWPLPPRKRVSQAKKRR